MEFEFDRRYDLPALLKFDDLDVRQAVKYNSCLVVGQYFDIISRFLNQTPAILAVLFRIAALGNEKVDLYGVTNLGYLLDKMGCKKYLPLVDDIVRSGKRGHTEFAASNAKELSEKLNGLYTRLKDTEMSQEEADASDKKNLSGEEDISKYEDLPLKKALEMLEHKEDTRKMRILAIDDSPVMLKTISSILNDDYIVYGMTNPAMLGKFLKQVTPELFLLDYKMPEISGFDLVPVIRSFAEHKNTPIVFLTSEGSSDHVSAALTLGARDYIKKPFQPGILREKVAKHIVRKNPMKAKAA
jgi:CheY-like chemotaxis protein